MEVRLRRVRLPHFASTLALVFGLARGLGADDSRLGLVSFVRVPLREDAPAELSTALAQDRAGFLWIGTQDGLVRYDGYEFRTYRTDPARPRSLGGNYVRALLPTADGRLWIGTLAGGLSVYDPTTDDFVRYRRGPEGLSHDRVGGLAEDRSGQIWIATEGGLDRLDPRTGRVVWHRSDARDPRSLADDRVSGLLVDRAGQLWVGSRKGLQVFRDGGFERVAPPELDGFFVTRLFEDEDGRIWIGTTEGGAAVLDPRTGALRRLRPRPQDAVGLSHFWVYGFAQATRDEVWVATFGGGVDVVDTRSLRVVDRLRHDPSLSSTIGGDRVGALLKDRSGLLWVGTWGQGLARHDPRVRAFRALRASPTRPEGLSHPAPVRALEMQDGTVWVGTNGNGIDVMDLARGRIDGHRADPSDAGALSDGAVTCLAQGKDGTAWVATLDGTLHRRRPGTRRFDRLTVTQGLAGGPIRALTFGADGTLWAGSSEGLARIDPPSLSVRRYRHDPHDAASLSSNTVEAIAFTPDGRMWVGTDSGLNLFDPDRAVAARITHDPTRPDSLPHDWVPDMEVASGRLWIATPGGAALLRSWDGRTARFDSVAQRIGRPAEPVRAVLEDGEGQVWLGPRIRVDPRTWTFREFSPADGATLGNPFFASRSRTRDGSLLFGSPRGLLIVRPAAIRTWDFAPPLVVTAGEAASGLGHAPDAPRPITLPTGRRSLRLEFAALDLSAPEQLRYRYRLEGFDRDWTATDAAHRAVAYTNLPTGSFALVVQGSNRAGVFSPHEIRIPIDVPPALHETGLYRALLGALGAVAVYGGYRLRVGALRTRGQRLERIVAERTLELREAYARIEEASLTDPLTGLRNRRFLEQTISADQDISLRRHRDGLPDGDLVFLLLDLDHFKSVNDAHGHAAGDAVLVQLSALLLSTVRNSDHVVRWGGEEFLVVMRFGDREQAPALAEKIRATIESHPFDAGDTRGLHKTASIGFATFPFAPEDPSAVAWEAVVDLADAALYAAKRSGRNLWVGLSAGPGEAPREAVAALKADPEAAISGHRLRALASTGAALRWS